MLTSLALYSLYKYFIKKRGEGDDSTSTTEKEKAAARPNNTCSNMQIDMRTVLLCSVFMFVGPALILLNKFILQNLHFPYPMFLSALGVCVSAFVARIFVLLGFVKLQRKEQVEGILWFKRVLPVGLAHAGTLCLGNSVYLYLDVGFIQMLKSFTPVIILICSSSAGLEYPNMVTILSIIVICVGTATTCSFVPTLDTLGIILMLFSELSEAIRLLMTQFLLQNLKFGVVEGQYVLAPATALWLGIASLWFEGERMMADEAFSVMAANPSAFVVASCLGLAVNFLAYLVIQATSSLTIKVLGVARTVLTIVVGVLLWDEPMTPQSCFGYALSLVGFVTYNLSKMDQPAFHKVVLPAALTAAAAPCGYLQEKLDAYEAGRLRWQDRKTAEKEAEAAQQLARSKDSVGQLDSMEMAPMKVGTSSGSRVTATTVGNGVGGGVGESSGKSSPGARERKFSENPGGEGTQDSLLGDGATSSSARTPSKKKYSTGKLYVEG